MDFEGLNAFIMVADKGSFSLAANQLHLIRHVQRTLSNAARAFVDRRHDNADFQFTKDQGSS